MRILFCNYEYPPLGGGGGVINALLAQALAQRHEVTVLTSQGLGLPAESTEKGVRVLRVPVFFRKKQAAANMLSLLAYVPMGIRSGRQLLKTSSFDVFNTHFALPSGPVGNVLARQADVPNVLSVHGGDLYDPSKFTSPHRHWVLRRWIVRLLRRADRVVGQSSNTIANLHKYYDPNVAAVKIPLGIQRPDFKETSRADCGYKETDILLVTVGRLVARKAVGQLIDGLVALRDDRVHVLVIGDGPQKGMLEDAAKKKGVAERVHLLGFISEDEKNNLLQISDLYVSTSQHEGFGLVFLEAMAAGLPVICYDHGGQTDFLEDSRTGSLVHLNDFAGFTQACKQLIDSPEKRRAAGNYNRERAEEYFIENCAARYEALFEEVVAAGPARVVS